MCEGGTISTNTWTSCMQHAGAAWPAHVTSPTHTAAIWRARAHTHTHTLAEWLIQPSVSPLTIPWSRRWSAAGRAGREGFKGE